MSTLRFLARFGRRRLQQLLAFPFLLLVSATQSASAWFPADLLHGFEEPVSLNLHAHRWQLKGTGNIMPLNGSSQYLDLGNDPLLHMSEHDFTVEAWVQFNALASQDPDCTDPVCGDMSLVDKMRSDFVVDGDGWRLLKTADNHLWFCLGSESDGCAGGNATTAQSSTAVTTGPWYHVVGRKTAGTLSIFVNGDAEATILLGSYTDTGRAHLLVGRNEAQGAFLNGTIDTVGLYPRALQGHQIRELYNRGLPYHSDSATSDGDQTAEAPAAAAATATATTPATAQSLATASGPSVGQLLVSRFADRSDPLPLNGLAVSGPVHVFLAPGFGVQQVKFWLDSPTPAIPADFPASIEYLAPFDLMGTSPTGAALPLDGAQLAKGTHTISAEAALVDGTRLPVLTAAFTVR